MLAEDKLFATLDPTTRRLSLPSGKEVLLTDTVGFIQVRECTAVSRQAVKFCFPAIAEVLVVLWRVQKLPTQLIAAFQATLEEIESSTLLMHIVDVSHPNASAQSASVLSVRNRMWQPQSCQLEVLTFPRHAGAERARGGSLAAGTAPSVMTWNFCPAY